MATLEQLALVVLGGLQLEARAIAQELLRDGLMDALTPPNPEVEERVAIMSAALAELLAGYAEIPAPRWTRQWGEMPVQIDLLPAKSHRLRTLLAGESPEPLRSRNILAPKDFLRAV